MNQERCMVCERIDQIKSGKNPYFVKGINSRSSGENLPDKQSLYR